MQFEALESQITDHHPRIREQELFFSHIWQRHFFLVFNLEFVKILTYFDIKTFGCWFTLSDSKVKVFLPPPPPVTLLGRQTWSADEERRSVDEQIEVGLFGQDGSNLQLQEDE